MGFFSVTNLYSLAIIITLIINRYNPSLESSFNSDKLWNRKFQISQLFLPFTSLPINNIFWIINLWIMYAILDLLCKFLFIYYLFLLNLYLYTKFIIIKYQIFIIQ